MSEGKWAIQAQNTLLVSAEKPINSTQGAAKSAANSEGNRFTAAIAAIMMLPLTDQEKTEAVRRLLRK